MALNPAPIRFRTPGLRSFGLVKRYGFSALTRDPIASLRDRTRLLAQLRFYLELRRGYL
jgi:hypothetical protein